MSTGVEVSNFGSSCTVIASFGVIVDSSARHIRSGLSSSLYF